MRRHGARTRPRGHSPRGRSCKNGTQLTIPFRALLFPQSANLDAYMQSDPHMIKQIVDAVTIPVMAKVRIGHFVEAQVGLLIKHGFFILPLPRSLGLGSRNSSQEETHLSFWSMRGTDSTEHWD